MQSKTKQTVIKNIKGKSKVGIWLDSYDNLFSDFDPRIYKQRTLSEDFLGQAQRITHELTPGVFDLVFLIPKKIRNRTTEKVIQERLKKHFKNKAQEIEQKKKGVTKRGLITTVIGLIMMFISTIIAYNFETQTYWSTALLVLFEPGGWFSAWYGLDMIFYTAQEHNEELAFYKKLSSVEVNFETYA